MSEFNLLDEPFISVQWSEGGSGEVSLTDAFREGAAIARIEGELPTQGFAILRVLLAVLQDTTRINNARQWRQLWSCGLPIDQICAYLDSYRDRFWLFDDNAPFMQVAGLHTAKNETSGLEKLIADVPNGHQFFTTRCGESLQRISPAEAARWLIHAQAFDPSGIRSGAVGDPRVKNGKGYPIGPGWAGQIGGLVWHGNSLAETLVLNTVPLPAGAEQDRPVWAMPPQDATGRDLTSLPDPGRLELLTWQPRRVRLVGDGSGVVGVVLSQGDKMTPQNRHASEMMTAWRYSKPQTAKLGVLTYMPRKHDPARSLWRNLPTVITDPVKNDAGVTPALRPGTLDWLSRQTDSIGSLDRLKLQAVGIDYGPQEATISELVNDCLDLQASVLADENPPVRAIIDIGISGAEECARVLGRLASRLVQAGGERGDGAGEGEYQTAALRFFAAIDDPSRQWIGSLNANTDEAEALRLWQGQVAEIAKLQARELLDRASPRATQGAKTREGFTTAATAERMFWGGLRKCLPLAFTSADSTTKEEEETNA